MKHKRKIKSKFVYPEIINATHHFFKLIGAPMTRKEIYTAALKSGAIYPDGAATEKSIREQNHVPIPATGLIGKMKAEYPEVRHFGNEHFKADPSTGRITVDSYVVMMVSFETLTNPAASLADKERAAMLLTGCLKQ